MDKGPQFWYHASDTAFEPGDVITPQNYTHAFATSDKSLAQEYGKHLHEVTPVDPEEAERSTMEDLEKWAIPVPENQGPKVIKKSKVGFRVVKRHG